MQEPTRQAPVFHLTHWKSGSQWIRGLLGDTFPGRVVEPLVANRHVTEAPIERGRIYPTVYMDRRTFEAIAIPPDSALFVVIRDLRDTLISSYFSLLKSHPLTTQTGVPHPGVAQIRQGLEARSKEDGLIHLIQDSLAQSALIQSSWVDSDARIFRFESLIEDGAAAFAAILDFCGLAYDDELLEAAVQRQSFENRAGRARGEEDTTSHFRKGVSGDWRAHFTDRVKAAFKARYGEHLIQTGYETGADW